jgi:amidase
VLRRIRREEVQAYARRAGFTLADGEVDEFLGLCEGLFEGLDAFDAEPPVVPERLPGTRDPGRRATPADDPLNAVVRWCEATGADDGPLAGLRIGLKDNIAIAGVPMTCGSRILAGYVPEVDATVTERLLAAGARIVAVLNMDDLAWSGGGETSSYGYTRNPFDPARTAAGSSGGPGAACWYDEIDATLGTDQGGSIRLPAAWCGVLGLKATHGLVPYTGIAGIDPTYDHVGPLARDTRTLARVLQAIAGHDPADPRQHPRAPEDYVAAVEDAPDDLAGLTIGVLAEAFSFEGPDAPPGTAETAEATREAIGRLAQLGATIREISVPEHLTGGGLMFAALVEGQWATAKSFGNGFGWRGRYAPDFATALGRGMRAAGDHLPPTVKLINLMGEYVHDHYFGALYGKAQNAAPVLRARYDAALAEVDVLLTSTANHYAHLALPDAPVAERVLRGWGNVANAAPFDVTGHPAITLPAAEADGLPVGVQLVAPHFAERRLLAVARTYERAHGWLPSGQPHLAGETPVAAPA